MRISDWSSDVCSSDLDKELASRDPGGARRHLAQRAWRDVGSPPPDPWIHLRKRRGTRGASPGRTTRHARFAAATPARPAAQATDRADGMRRAVRWESGREGREGVSASLARWTIVD